MVSSLLEPCVHVEVLDTPPVITMSKESLYSGISGSLIFNILVGSRPISEEEITFELSKGLELITESTMASVKNYNYKDGRRASQQIKPESQTKYEVMVNLIGDGRVQICLPTAQSRSEVSFSLAVRSPLQWEVEIADAISESASSMGDLDEILDESIVSTSRNHRINASLSSMTSQPQSFDVQFRSPFKFRSSVRRNLVLLTIQNVCQDQWILRNYTCKCLSLSEGERLYLTPTLSGFEILNNATLIFQKWLVTRLFANIFHYFDFSEKYL